MQKATRTFLSFAIIFFLLIGFVCAYFGTSYEVKLMAEKPRYLEKDIYVTDCDTNITTKVNLPYQIHPNKSGKYSIKTTLDRYYNDDTNAIAINSEHMSLDVSLNDCYIYSHRFDREKMDYSHSNGRNFHLIDLNSNYYGKDLIIDVELLLNDGVDYIINPIAIGSKYAICADIFAKESLNIILCGVNVIIIFVCLVFTILFKRGIKDKKIDQLYYVNLFMIFYTMLMFLELLTSGFVIANSYLRYFVKYCSLMIIHVPIMFMYKEYCNDKEKKIFDLIIIMELSNFIVQTILNFGHIMDYAEMIVVTPIINSIGIIYMAYVSIKLIMKKKNTDNLFHISMLFFLMAVLLDVVWAFTEFDVKVFSQLCVIVFAVIQITIAGKALLNYYKMGIHSRVYENLALTDNMTTLSNRFAFDRDVMRAEKYIENHPSVWCCVIDINNLKQVNDTLGHQAGDDLIIYVAQMLILTFEEYGDVFRIGGDEFAVVVNDENEDNVKERMDYLNNLIEKANKVCNKFLISIAVGYDKYNPKIDNDFNDLFVRADKLMYENKVKIKAKQGIEAYR